MKKILLVLSVFIALNMNAQIVNSSFDNWTTSTAYFDGFGVFPPDTFQISDPDDWTTTNALSGADTFGALSLVTESNDAHTGSSALEVTTQAFDTVATPLGPRQLVIPGLALNGVFPLDIPTDVLLGGGTISPVLIPGAGQSFNQRLDSLKGFFKYFPVFNDSTGSYDTCMVWATLKKGTEIVANAIFKTNDSITTYTEFSVPFDYVSCSAPDTLVILIASSVPNFGNLLFGTTSLVPGSRLLIDDLDYVVRNTAPERPIARFDSVSTAFNTAVTIAVKANDTDCDNVPMNNITTAVVVGPSRGTAAITAGGDITYTPHADSSGVDSLSYTISDGTNTSYPAWVKVLVMAGVGISEANEIPVSVFPVPASDLLNIQFENSGNSTLRIFDVAGKLALTSVLTANSNTVNIAELSAGLYSMQISGDNNTVIARSKFTVAK